MAFGVSQAALDRAINAAEEAFARAIRKAFRAATETLRAGAGDLVAAALPVPGTVDPADLIVAKKVWESQVDGLMHHITYAYGRSATQVAAVLTGNLPDPGNITLTDGLSGEVINTADMFVVPIGDEIPVNAKLAIDNRAQEYLTTASNRLVRVGDAAWADIRGRLVEGFTQGEGIDKLAARLRDARDISERRARTIARTEVVGASNAGAMAGARAYPGLEPETKTWLAQIDGRTRASHIDANGQTVPLDKPFIVGGEEMDAPHASGAPAREVVNCRCTVTFGDPLPLPPPPEPEPIWRAPTFDGLDQLKPLDNQPHLAGAHPKTVLVGPDGRQYLFKPMQEWMAHGEMVAGQVAERAGLETPRVWSVHYRGQSGSLQEMLPNARNAFPGSPFEWDPLRVDAADLNVIQRHRALDWMIGNHDAHGGQWIREGYASQGRRVVGIDKGQAFKHFGSDELDYHYHPNGVYGEARPVYNILEEAYANNTLGDGLYLRPSSPKLKGTVDKLMGIDDDEYAAMLRPYAEGRFGGPGQAVDDFIRAAIERKNNLSSDLSKYEARLYRSRTKLRAPRPKPAESISGGPGGPKGFTGAVESRNDYDWMAQHDSPHQHRTAAQALNTYTGHSYSDINGVLRRGASSAYDTKWVNTAAQMRKELGTIKTDMYVNRAFSIKLPTSISDLQGAVLHDRAFLSTSTTGEGGSVWFGDVNMKLRLNAGTKASWVDNISQHVGEREVIVGDGQYVYVHKIEQFTDTYGQRTYKVEAEVVSESWVQSSGTRVWDTNRAQWAT